MGNQILILLTKTEEKNGHMSVNIYAYPTEQIRSWINLSERLNKLKFRMMHRAQSNWEFRETFWNFMANDFHLM